MHRPRCQAWRSREAARDSRTSGSVRYGTRCSKSLCFAGPAGCGFWRDTLWHQGAGSVVRKWIVGAASVQDGRRSMNRERKVRSGPDQDTTSRCASALPKKRGTGTSVEAAERPKTERRTTHRVETMGAATGNRRPKQCELNIEPQPAETARIKSVENAHASIISTRTRTTLSRNDFVQSGRGGRIAPAAPRTPPPACGSAPGDSNGITEL